MGGFYLRGPTHGFASAHRVNCLCPGLVGEIGADLEARLLKRQPRILDTATDLPPDLRQQVEAGAHIGYDMEYTVVERREGRLRGQAPPPAPTPAPTTGVLARWFGWARS